MKKQFYKIAVFALFCFLPTAAHSIQLDLLTNDTIDGEDRETFFLRQLEQKNLDADLSYYCQENPTNLNIVARFLAQGANPNRWNCLKDAVKNENIQLIRMLVKAGADLNAQDILGYTPLAIAVKDRLYDMVELLLELGAETND